MHTILGIVAFLVVWAVAIGMAIFLIDCISRLVCAMETSAEARMRQAKALETLASRNETAIVPKE